MYFLKYFVFQIGIILILAIDFVPQLAVILHNNQ